MGGAIINHLIFCLLQRPVIGNVVKQSQFLNRTPVKFHPNETSMPTIASKENVNNQPCEFHQTNNLDKLFTDETSMIFFKYKSQENMFKKYYARAKRFHSFSNF